MLVQGVYSKAFGKGLHKQFQKAYTEHYDFPVPKNFIIPKVKKLIAKNYSLGFQISRQLIKDDLYGDVFNMKKAKKMMLKVQTLHRVYIDNMGTGVELNGDDIIFMGSSTLTIEQGKDMVKALNMLLKLAKAPKKVVRRRRRVKK